MNLNDLRKYTDGEIKCDVCSDEEEDLIHFLVRCRGLEDRRDKELIKKFRGVDDRATVGKMLFKANERDIERLKRMLRIMWSERKLKSMRKKEEGKKKRGEV